MKKMVLSLMMLSLWVPALFAEGEGIETKYVNRVTVTSPCGTAQLKVALKQIDEKDLRVVEKGELEEPDVWLGKEKIPSDILWRDHTMIQSFELTIDGKTVEVPVRFYNDIAGLLIEDLVLKKGQKKFTEDQEELRRTIHYRPQISRSQGGSTVLISWGRPEE